MKPGKMFQAEGAPQLVIDVLHHMVNAAITDQHRTSTAGCQELVVIKSRFAATVMALHADYLITLTQPM